MSSESPPAPARPARAKPSTPRPDPDAAPTLAARLADAGLVALFLGLTFLLGLFPLKDTDFWWHLRTGDLIRQGAGVPRTDWYTFTVPENPWVDLHWGFQVAISWVYERGGVPALNLAKSAVTCLAMLLLLSARRREWPVWATVLAWLPALLVLSGRMYVRPETLSLLCLAAVLAIVFRWDRNPWLAFGLPVVMAAWANVQGIFVLGLAVIGAAVLDAALTPGAFAPSRRGWWKVVGAAVALSGLACLANPYGLAGALYPLDLARTMGNPIFSRTILELQSIPDFLASAGLTSLPMNIHLATMLLGGLSFVVPILWVGFARIADARAGRGKATPAPPPAAKGKGSRKGAKGKATARPASPWRLSPLRLILFAAFSFFSLKATRNSHQFAAVVGTVTAWNLAEWAAAIRRRRAEAGRAPTPAGAVAPRLVAAGAIVGLMALVGSGTFYAWAGEGRTVGLGEEPLWFPHEAAKFAGRPGMPDRMVGFHNGHPALYTYYHGPEKKIYADARLEVIGPEMYERYLEFQRRISENRPGWAEELDRLGRPAVLVDNVNVGLADISATLYADGRWRCVYWDPIAAVFAHESTAASGGFPAVDLAARHFRPDPADGPDGLRALLASSKALRNLAIALQKQGRFDLARPAVLLGLAQARRALAADPDGAEAWRAVGLLETIREARLDDGRAVPRFRAPLDPVLDAGTFRTTYALEQAVRRNPADFTAILTLESEYARRGMWEQVVPLVDRLLELPAINVYQRQALREIAARRGELAAQLGPWENRGDLERLVEDLLAKGRPAAAADLLERSYRPASRPWDVTDRIATLRLHLGEPSAAREALLAAVEPPSPALRAARVALTHRVEGDLPAARERYREALALDPDLFEALHGLAALEVDAGRPAEALDAARRAVEAAPNDLARRDAQSLAALVTPHAGPAPAGAVRTGATAAP